ncbi:MAG: DUF2800 domain-containing protein [Hyphomicrobium sp.]|jgi:hypothetical protein
MTTEVTTIDHSQRAHSPVGGSSAERVLNCTASVELCARYENVETEFAAEGTACHEAIDLILMGKTRKDTDVIGVAFNKNTVVMTEELFHEAIVPALDMFDALDRELGGIEFFNEQRVVFPGIENAFGTADIVGTSRDRTIVWDWKFGRGKAVYAEANPQLLYYAYAAAHTAPTNKFFAPDKPIEVFIAQPRTNDGEPFTRWMTGMVQLEAFALELRQAVEIAFTTEATFNLGPWCQFCNAKRGCPLYTNKVQEVGLLTREQLEAELEKWLPYADTMIAWGKDVKDAAHKLLEQGGRVPGWKLVNGRQTRNWVDEDRALKHFARMGLPAAERHVKKIISPKQAEDRLKAAGLPAELPKALVDSRPSGTTLAPESDKRPAVAIAPDALKLLADRLAAK